MKMAHKKTLYEFSVLREREDYPHWTYTDKIYVLAINKEEAMRKFLNKHPDFYNFTITNWQGVDIL